MMFNSSTREAEQPNKRSADYSMTPAQDAAELRRLSTREAALQAELRAIRASKAVIGNRLCFAHGYKVVLRGPALRRLAEEVA